MDKQAMITQLKAHADFLRVTQFNMPLREVGAINHVLKCAASLEILAKELENDETAHQQGE